jgi:hypothetical protein
MMRTGRILHTHALLHAGLHAANYARGRTKAVWVSTSADLRMDAERDLRDLGCPIKVINGTKVSLHACVLLSTGLVALFFLVAIGTKVCFRRSAICPICNSSGEGPCHMCLRTTHLAPQDLTSHTMANGQLRKDFRQGVLFVTYHTLSRPDRMCEILKVCSNQKVAGSIPAPFFHGQRQ